MNDREYLEWIAYKITMTKIDKKCEILQIFVERSIQKSRGWCKEVNNLNVIIDTEREYARYCTETIRGDWNDKRCF